MVDSLRHDLTQVIRQCGTDISITAKQVNQILNGHYKDVIAEIGRVDKKAKPTNLDSIAVPPNPES